MNLTEDDAVVPDAIAAGQGPALAAGRTPASVPAVGSRISSAISHLAQLDLRCAKKAQSPLRVEGSYVQFEGKNCLRDKTLEIVNKSNGYTASVFLKGTDKYQTDLIQLQKGDNEITIRYHDGPGKAVEEVVQVHSNQI
ncbi:hypothetical protein EZJ49_01705 [Bdellovibrio bacteriovorus]|uniref:hypothetical protein n=1 Tax=Bdellovibrio bacteriovorus TaxID=959 RepID=UPI0021CE3338|nr:hypothetical protein [Bdellovibrio bacteriovorus]UXR64964.1 hypothetical protein EZJ49_01705 [Bdellovibrio bacteriovorus]